jgi:hypothetical protein
MRILYCQGHMVSLQEPCAPDHGSVCLAVRLSMVLGESALRECVGDVALPHPDDNLERLLLLASLVG